MQAERDLKQRPNADFTTVFTRQENLKVIANFGQRQHNFFATISKLLVVIDEFQNFKIDIRSIPLKFCKAIDLNDGDTII